MHKDNQGKDRSGTTGVRTTGVRKGSEEGEEAVGDIRPREGDGIPSHTEPRGLAARPCHHSPVRLLM